MTALPRMHQMKNGGPLAEERIRHLPQPQTYESFRTPKSLSKTPASGGFFRAVMTVEAAIAFSLFLLLCGLFFTFYQEQAAALRAQKALDEICEAVAEWSYAVSFAEKYTGTDLMSITDGSEISSVLAGEEKWTALLGGKEKLIREVKAFLLEKGAAVLWQAAVREIVAEKIGEEALKAAGVEGGAAGLSLSGSTLRGRELDLVLSFRIASKVGFPFRLHIPVTVRSMRRLWTGTVLLQHEEHAQEETEEEENIVYVTDNGEVFHRSLQCRILKIRPTAVPAAEVGDLRNRNGAKYYPCDYCCRGRPVTEGLVYITNEGIRYHAERDCGEITRYVRKISLSEAEEHYRPCFYCGQEAG